MHDRPLQSCTTYNWLSTTSLKEMMLLIVELNLIQFDHFLDCVAPIFFFLLRQQVLSQLHRVALGRWLAVMVSLVGVVTLRRANRGGEAITSIEILQWRGRRGPEPSAKEISSWARRGVIWRVRLPKVSTGKVTLRRQIALPKTSTRMGRVPGCEMVPRISS